MQTYGVKQHKLCEACYLYATNTIYSSSGRYCALCSGCTAVVASGKRLLDKYGFVWSLLTNGTIRCRHQQEV